MPQATIHDALGLDLRLPVYVSHIVVSGLPICSSVVDSPFAYAQAGEDRRSQPSSAAQRSSALLFSHYS